MSSKTEDKTTKFSIILPTYNRAGKIIRAINSVLDQTLLQWQLIIVDDGSTDKTEELIKPFLRDRRILYLKVPHEGVGRARNTGIRHAEGEWICFLDSDDYYLADHLSVIENFLIKNRNKPTFIYTGSFVEEGGQLRELPMCESNQDPVSHFLHEFLMINSVCLPRMAFEEHLFPEYCTTWQDLHLWYRLVSLFPFAQLSQRTSVVVQHSGRNHMRIANSRSIAGISKRIDCMNDLFDRYSHVLSTQVKSIRGELILLEYSRWCNRFIKAKRERLAVRVLIHALSDFIRYRRLSRWMRLFSKTILYRILYNSYSTEQI